MDNIYKQCWWHLFSHTDRGRYGYWEVNLPSWLPSIAMAAHFLACHAGDNSQQAEPLKWSIKIHLVLKDLTSSKEAKPRGYFWQISMGWSAESLLLNPCAMCASNGMCLCMCVWGPHATPYMWQSEDNLQVLVLTFPSCLIQTLYCCINQVSWLTDFRSFICLLPFPIACWDHRDLYYHVQLLCRFRGSKCRL